MSEPRLPLTGSNPQVFVVFKAEMVGKTNYYCQNQGCAWPADSATLLAKLVRTKIEAYFETSRGGQALIQFLSYLYIVHSDRGSPELCSPLSESEQEEFWEAYDPFRPSR